MICKFDIEGDEFLCCQYPSPENTLPGIMERYSKHKNFSHFRSEKFEYLLSFSFTRQAWMIRNLSMSMQYDYIFIGGFYDL